MRRAAMPRWAVSFADLSLLLLAFFVLLHAGNAREVAASARAAFAGEPLPGPLLEARADSLFEPGEARLTAAAKARLLRIARLSKRPLVVESEGRDAGARRFDGWELAAARAAAVARALSEGGVAEERVSIILPRGNESRAKGQRLIVRAGG